MTKSTKHKQQVRREKNKIKLKLAQTSSKTKGGKTLPKGLNVTDTSFKTRKIVIPSHRDDDSGQPSTSKKHNLKEVLSHLQHFSISIRQDGLRGLKELIQIDPAIIPIHLNTILERLGELAVGKEPTLRSPAIKELHFVLKQVPEPNIVPFFPLLMAYLSMGLSHINSGIQHDALTLLDVLTETMPNLLAKAAAESRLLPNFLEQISRKSDSGKGKDAVRILVVNPNQRMTSLKWRYQVLTRIWKVLTLLPLDKQTSAEATTVLVHETESTYAPIYATQTESVLNVLEDGLLGNESTVNEFIDLLKQILVETWVEASADQIRENGSVLTSDTADMLNCILELYLLTYKLYSYISNASLSKTDDYGTEFIGRFIKGFPYSQNKGSMNTANLNICLLWAIHPRGNETFIVNYLSRISTALNAEDAVKFNEMLLTLCQQDDPSFAQRVIPSVVNHTVNNFPRKDSLTLLNGLVRTITLSAAHHEKIAALAVFRHEIPLLLNKCTGRVIPPVLLNGLCKIAQQGSPKFVQHLRQSLGTFLGQASKVPIAEKLGEIFQQNFNFLAYWAIRDETKHLQIEFLDKLKKFGVDLERLERFELLLTYYKEIRSQ